MFLTSLRTVGIADILDIVLVSVFLYSLLFWFKKAKAAGVAKGMLVLAAVYLLSRATGMVLTTSIFHGFFAILLVALVVIFQEELRSVFERIAVWSFGSSRDEAPVPEGFVEPLVRSLGDLARERIGALVVLRGRDPLDRHLDGGWTLGGEVSEPILKSIFDEHSLGHDGAVVLEDGRITRFGCRLPLSREFGQTAQYGTRHAAALGMSERTDALCLVVSEERGTILAAREGRFEAVSGLGELEALVRRFHSAPRNGHPSTVRLFLAKNTREKAVAMAAAILLWIGFVLGAKDARHAFDVPVRVRNVPQTLEVARVDPQRVSATFISKIRNFYRNDERHIAVHLDMSQAGPGLNRAFIGESDVMRPADFILDEVVPWTVQVELRQKPPAPKP